MKQNASFFCEQPASAAAYCLQQFPDTAKATIALADELCRNTFTFREHWEMERTHIPVTFQDEIDWEHIPAGDPEWTYALNRHTSFVVLGKAYLYTGKEEYAACFVRLAKSWLSQSKLCDETKNGSWRSLEAGLRCENWLRAMRMFASSPSVPPTLFDEMNASLAVHSDYLQETSADFHVLSNWGVLQDNGLFLLGLYFDKPALCALAVSRLAVNVDIQVMRDGSHWEQSPMYHCEVLHCFLNVVLAARQNGYALPKEFEASVQRMCAALGAWIKPNGFLPMQGDSDDIDARDLLALGAVLFADGSLKFAANSRVFEENIWDCGPAFIEQYQAIAALAPACPSRELADSGNWFMREDNSETAVWMHFHCGCLGSGHGHADQLHIDLAAFGEDVLIDSGRYTYVDSPIRKALKSAEAHNTTRVDGIEFSEQLDSWGYRTLANPIKEQAVFTPKADYVSGAHLGYFANGVFVRRRVLYIKPDIFVVFDTFCAKGTHSYEAAFHFGEGTVTQTANGAAFMGKAACASLVCLGNVKTTLNSQPVSREYNSLTECAALVARAEAEGDFTMISVIAVGKKGEDNALTAELLPVTARRKKIILPKTRAAGVRIVKNEREYTVLCCHEELISEVELLETNGHCGYGKLVLFAEGLPDTGLCMEW